MTINGRLTIKYSCYMIAIMGLFAAFVIAKPAPVQACTPVCAADSATAAALIPPDHLINTPILAFSITAAFSDLEKWLVDDLFKTNIRPIMQDMTQKLSAAAVHRTFTIGTFFDAKEQLEAQRDHQYLQAIAHKDYQPSNAFCSIGTSVRSLAASESKRGLNQRVMARHEIVRSLGNQTPGAGLQPAKVDMDSRWDKFVTTYCNPSDNKWANGTDFSKVCPDVTVGARTNRDVDFTRFIDEARTIDNVDFTDGVTSAEEEDILSLSSNLYHHNLKFQTGANEEVYFNLRAIQSRRAVATDSFQNIVALKAAGTAKDGDKVKTREYLGALVNALGVPKDEVFSVIGEAPSYFAQLELLSKKIAQNPTFFANLYDKPANVERISVALRAIELMIDREIYESHLRQEMQASALLSSRLAKPFEEAKK